MAKRVFLYIGLGAVVFVVGYVMEMTISAGVFRSIEPHFSGTCTRVDGVVGAEDITIDPVTGIAYISAMDRRTLAATGDYHGGIYRYMPGSFEAPSLMSLDLETPFHPHGISLWKNKNGNDRLFVVAHPPSDENPNDPKLATSQVDVFEIKGNSLTYIYTAKPSQAISLNDVAAVGPDSFYASIDKGSVTKFGQQIEQFGRLARSGVLYGKGTATKRALSELVYANGVQTDSTNGTLYVAETTGKRLSSYKIEDDGNLTFLAEQDIDSGLDNIEIDENGDLYIVGHPKTFDFLGHAGDAAKKSPSQVFRINQTGDAFAVKEIYLNDGKEMSGASVAAPVGDRFLLGSVFEPFILDCRF